LKLGAGPREKEADAGLLGSSGGARENEVEGEKMTEEGQGK
jgi:hypothetical protein